METNRLDYLGHLVRERFGISGIRAITPANAGTVNLTWRIDGAEPWILRCYGPETCRDRIDFEHALLFALRGRGYPAAPAPLADAAGESLIEAPDALNLGFPSPFFAVFSFIDGESPYDWNSPDCSHARALNAGAAFATYHRAIFGWKFQGPWREPDMVAMTPSLLKRGGHNDAAPSAPELDRLLKRHQKRLRHRLDKLRHFFDKADLSPMPRLAIHGDYHPGNVIFTGERVAGIIDFDWARMDLRLTDVALALLYFCGVWNEEVPAPFDRRKCSTFMTGYGSDWPVDHPLPPITEPEWKMLPNLMRLSNLCIIDWIWGEVRHQRQRPHAALPWLDHACRISDWLDINAERLVRGLTPLLGIE